jgi:hypothetical protein
MVLVAVVVVLLVPWWLLLGICIEDQAARLVAGNPTLPFARGRLVVP